MTFTFLAYEHNKMNPRLEPGVCALFIGPSLLLHEYYEVKSEETSYFN